MRRKILVVEDNNINRTMLKNILGNEYDIIEAENGEEALAILAKKHKLVSAVLLDIVMPVLDGFEVLKRMRANAMLAQIPVIIVTGSRDEQTEVRALALGANDYITKPYNPALILHCLRNTINLRETASIVNAIQRDKLTGLYNREAFFEKVESLIGEHEPGYYVLSCFDIDNFKVINDQYGSEEGDRILRNVSRIVREDMQKSGGIVGRISADNFSALYPAEMIGRGVGFFAKLRDEQAVGLDTNAAVTFSVGRYIVNDLSLSASAIYDRAYIAKQSVKGRYDEHIAYFDETMRERLLREQQITGEMDGALSLRQFEVWFQPQFNHSTGALIGAEALTRWRHPKNGLMSPDTFIPVFESNGFVYELDKYVWEEACRYLRKWSDEGRSPLPVSVNISRYDVFRGDVVEVITGLTRQYDIPPALLRLEITESAFSHSSEQIIAVVKQLMDCGFTVEIDDFGSGYSSLNTLKDVPAGVLKLDMRFLENNTNSQRGGNILESIVRMAKWLDMAVIAEGVETVEQANFLKSIGCNYVQGYLYAKPMPASDYEALAQSAAKESRLLTLETVESLDNNAFWDPKSMETLIFNTYIGGACIFEWHNQKIEILRTNDKYAQTICGEGATAADAMSIVWENHMDAESSAATYDAIARAIETGDDAVYEAAYIDLPGTPGMTYLRTTFRMIARAGDRFLMYATNENITAQRQAEEKEREIYQQLQAIVGNINGGVTMAVTGAEEPRLLFANDEYYAQLGYTKKQFQKEVANAYDLVHPEDREHVAAQTRQASLDFRPFSVLYRVICRDKAVKWLRSNITVARLPGIGDPVQIAVANDVTETIRLQDKERMASEQLQAIMKDVGSGITATIISLDDVFFLMANDKYYELLGYTRSQYGAEVQSSFELIHPEDRQRVHDAAAQAYRSGERTQIEYRALRRDATTVWIRAILSATRFTGITEPIQLGIYTDITDEIRAEQEIKDTDEQLRFLNETAHTLLAQPDAELALTDVLQKLIAYFNGNRAYIFELDYTNGIANNTYEVCAPGVVSEKSNLQNVPLSVMDFWLRTFDNRKYINITDVNELSDSRAEEREILGAQGIRSLIAVPLNRDGRLIGFIGIDDPHQQNSRTDRLVALGDYLAVMLTRRDLNAKIMNDNKVMQSFMNDTPGGFVRMQALPGGTIVPAYFNDGFCKLTGMTTAELMEMYGRDSYAGVHPDDINIVREAVAAMMEHGEGHSAKYRIRSGGGGYIWVMIFGRKTQTEAGEVFLNVYYTDVSEQTMLEEKREELLDNLPCGAGIYEISGSEIRAVYLNKRYRAYLHREIGDLSEAPVFEVVHPEDRPRLSEALQTVLTQRTEESRDIRIMDGSGGYITFRLVGYAMEHSVDRNAIYVTFTPVTREEQTYSEMLPVALAAVVGASADIAYVKDRDFRYVCCSRPFAEAAGVADVKDVIGKTDYDLLDKAYADKYRAGEEKLIKSRQANVDYEEVMPTAHGSVRYAVTSKYPLMDSGGSVVGIYGVTRDVTRAHEIDSQLKLLTDSIPGGLATYLCTGKSVKILYFNDGFASLFGFTRDEYAKRSAKNPMSMVLADDLAMLTSKLDDLIHKNIPIECTYRARVKGGGFKWIRHKAVAVDRHGDKVIINAVLLDVTESQEAMERLRISEEEHRLAVQHSGNIVCRYNIASGVATMAHDVAARMGMEPTAQVPGEQIRRGNISHDTAEAYAGFFERIKRGDKTGSAVFEHKTADGWRWLEARFSTIFSDTGAPVSAVISFYDTTEQMEKEAVYKKWQQSLQEKPSESYTLFRCNLSRDASFDTVEGTLLQFNADPNITDFNDRTEEYARQCVYEEDGDRYRAMLNSDTLLANYYRGRRNEVLEYREELPAGGVRWLRLTIDLVEYPNSTDVEAYLMYENIDDSKRAELLTLQRAETDPLTGVLNRATFTSRVNALIRASKADTCHALLMLDIDGFKMVNDVFGHGAGDQALIDVAAKLRSVLRRGDLLGRLGGDEFIVFLNDIPGDAVAANKAKQICANVRKAFSVEVQISGSVGVVVCPRDGADFDELYKKADAALYYVKGSGKDSFAFYRENMDDEHLVLTREPEAPGRLPKSEKKRRMLIVDDNKIDYELLANLFCDEFIIEKAKDGASALIRLRHYGSAISVVLLDLVMPGMDGFAVLEKMQADNELRSIPVIVVSGDEDREVSLRAIRAGASDFVTKPVDSDLLIIRVHSAVSRAENERLRAQNSFLELKSGELEKYQTVFEHTGTVIVQHDWVKGAFIYDAAVSDAIAGNWDGRSMWQILLSDMVADVPTVKRMQELVRDIAEDRNRTEGSMTAVFKTPHKEKHLFRVNIYKRTNEYLLADKLVLTFTDIGRAPAKN